MGGLQSLRGIAALAVLFQHVTFYTTNELSMDYLPYLKIDFGRFGVELFFVISGFVMAGCLSQGRRFLWNRVLRIYPGFWLAVAASAILLSNPSFGWDVDSKSLLLVPAPLNNTYRVPYWTLVYEIAFYAATYAMIMIGASRETVSKICIGWIIVVIAVTKYKTIGIPEPGLWILLSRSNIYFIFGMLLGLHDDRIREPSSTTLAVGSTVLWCLGDAFAGIVPLPSDLMLALAFCGIVVLGIRHIQSAALEWIGDASFGIYLMHVPVTVLALKIIKSQFPSITLFPLWAATMIIAIFGAFTFGWFEAKMHARIKHMFSARKCDHTARIAS